MSKTKRWNLVRVVAKGEIIDLAAMRAADKVKQDQQAQDPQAENS